MQRLSAGAIGAAVLTLVLGGVIGVLGTVMHRSVQPWGLVVCLLLAFAAAVTARAWGGWVTLVGYAGGLFLSLQLMAQRGPGGDVLVPDGQAIGWVWVLGALAVTLLAGVLPRSLFDDRPRAPRADRSIAAEGNNGTGAPS